MFPKARQPKSAIARQRISQALKGKRKAFGNRVQRARGGLIVDRLAAKTAVGTTLKKAGFKKTGNRVLRNAAKQVLKSPNSRPVAIGAKKSMGKYYKLQKMLNKRK